MVVPRGQVDKALSCFVLRVDVSLVYNQLIHHVFIAEFDCNRQASVASLIVDYFVLVMRFCAPPARPGWALTYATNTSMSTTLGIWITLVPLVKVGPSLITI